MRFHSNSDQLAYGLKGKHGPDAPVTPTIIRLVISVPSRLVAEKARPNARVPPPFTVNEINKLTDRAAQVIELGFLRLLWDCIDQAKITSCAIQTGAPGIASLAAFDLEKATQPRNETERMKTVKFIDVTEGEPAEIRELLRRVLEHFYRAGWNI